MNKSFGGVRCRTNRVETQKLFAVVHVSVAEHNIQTSQGKRPLPLNIEKMASLGFIRKDVKRNKEVTQH